MASLFTQEAVGVPKECEEGSSVKAQWISLTAAVLMSLGYISQMIQVRETGNVSSFSRWTLIANIVGSFMWFVFGILNKIWANIITGAIYALFNLYYLSYFMGG